MAKVVEICGSPGVGKSTIFEEIIRRKSREDSWTTATNVNPYDEQSWLDFAKKIAREIRKGKKTLSNSRIEENNYEFVRRIYKDIKNGKDYVDQTALKEAGDRFVAQFPEYLEACWGNIYLKQRKSSNGMDLRFEKAEFIYRIIKKIQVLRENASGKYIIIDEGLINMIDRGLYKSTSPLEEKEEIYNLLEVMPLPDAIVYLETDLRENAKRLLSRRDIRDMHRGLSIDGLVAITKACRDRIVTSINFLEDKGIPVLYLDSSQPVRLNADKIITFTKSLNRSMPTAKTEHAATVSA
ncbi:hypothetical protein [uncultured Pontibacter sp.]|uniref:hypothetical protein n=1 Tax=uncultured Pontibacter sp. TaxID=453356 RepID=UPI002605A6A5|nr:hypothetical protein [uncultured Pontibacter sp.]